MREKRQLTQGSDSADLIKAAPSKEKGWLLWLILVAIVFFTIVRTMPWIPRVIPISEDDSWDLALNIFAKRGAFSGVDYIFTFGPLGFLYNRTYFPDTYNLKLLLESLICALTTAVMVLQSRKLLASWPQSIAWIFCLVSLYGFFGDVFFLAIPVLLVNQYFLLDKSSLKPSGETITLVSLLAVTALVKFTFFVAAVWVIAFIALDELLKKRPPIRLFLFASVFLLGWLLCGQPLANLPIYLSTSLAVAAGHSEAMSSSEAGWQIPILTTVVASGFLLIAFSWLAQQRMGKTFAIATLAESGLFF
ncbi:hypothetical protein BH11CYA1_BH11CYA1_33870 [soil metagenome]